MTCITSTLKEKLVKEDSTDTLIKAAPEHAPESNKGYHTRPDPRCRQRRCRQGNPACNSMMLNAGRYGKPGKP